MSQKRTPTRIVAFLCILIGALVGAVGLGMPSAWGDGGLKVTALPDNPHAQRSSTFIRVDRGTGNVAYCAQGWLLMPKVGHSLVHYGDLGIPELDYVLWHGYDGTVVTSLYGLDRARSEAATATAVWLAIAEQRPDILNHREADGTIYHGNKAYMKRWELLEDQLIKDASWRLYQEGLDYKKKGGGGIEAGCSDLWLNKNTVDNGQGPTYDYQALVTSNKKVSASFTKTSALASITDGNEEYSLAGAVYDIFLAKSDEKVASITTDEQGRAKMDLPPNENFYAIERTAPDGYELDGKRIPFSTSSSGGEVSTKDRPGSFTLMVSKKDAATGGPSQPGASLEGAEYTATSLSTAGWSQCGATDEDGVLSFTGIPYGDIEVVETKAPEGYLLDQTARTYHVDSPGAVPAKPIELIPEDDFHETPIAFDIEIAKFKMDGGEGSKLEIPAAGVSFEIVSGTTNKVVGTITTGEDGFATTEGLWLGEGERLPHISGALPYDTGGYLVREVPGTVPEGFERVDDWRIEPEQMANGAQLNYIVNNSRLTSRLQIVKRDRETNEVVPLAGFSFQVIGKGGKPISMEVWHPHHAVLDTFVTDETGMVTLPEPLPTGSYHVRETAAAPPYLANQEDVPFEIVGTQDEVTPITIISIADDRAMGSATIRKTCSDGCGALEGAEFDIVAVGDIASPIGGVDIPDGSVAAHVITDERGVAVAKGLPLGLGTARYAFVETKPPRGHVIDTEPIEFTLTYGDDRVDVVTAKEGSENEPTELVIEKVSAGSGETLEGAEFYIWNKDHEIASTPDTGFGSIFVETDGGTEDMVLEPVVTHAQLILKTGEGVDISLRDEEGALIETAREVALTPGDYVIECTASGGSRHHATPFKAEAGMRYELDARLGVLGLSCTMEKVEAISKPIELQETDRAGVHGSTRVPAGTYRIIAEGESRGTIQAKQGETLFWNIESENARRVPILLKDGFLPIISKTDENGVIVQGHLAPGCYRVCESKAPDGYITDWTTHELLVDSHGLIEGAPRFSLRLENDFTKVDISKRDITTELEVPGARLELRAEDGATIETWTSAEVPHRINALAPGTYALVEMMTPRTHDQTTEVTFEVRDTGDVQPISIYDEPIRIEGQVDKRQQIARPTDPLSSSNGDGLNRADESPSSDGQYLYTIDMRSTSSTWVDECTVDEIPQGAEEGLARVEEITTPVVQGDFDGELNIWYKTNLSQGPVNHLENATLDDGHENPWISQDEAMQSIGEDARLVDYTGWSLWKSGVPTDVASTLDVTDLALGRDEYIVGIRLEFGSVEAGFTSRSDDWGRADLKDEHDDIESPELPRKDGTSPLIVNMRVTDEYRNLSRLHNHTQLTLVRNGGGENLEDHDSDHVVQVPHGDELPQTGVSLPWYLGCGSLICAVAGAGVWLRRR